MKTFEEIKDEITAEVNYHYEYYGNKADDKRYLRTKLFGFIQALIFADVIDKDKWVDLQDYIDELTDGVEYDMFS